MKKITLIIIGITAVAQLLAAEIDISMRQADVPTTSLEQKKATNKGPWYNNESWYEDVIRIATATSAVEPKEIWKFELKNKMNKPIYVSLINNDKLILDQFKVAASQGVRGQEGFVRVSNLKPDKPTKILIQQENQKKFDLGLSYEIITGNKTIYVSYDKGILSLQGGYTINNVMFTESGLNLSDNIKMSDLTEIEVTSFMQSKNAITYKHILPIRMNLPAVK